MPLSNAPPARNGLSLLRERRRITTCDHVTGRPRPLPASTDGVNWLPSSSFRRGFGATRCHDEQVLVRSEQVQVASGDVTTPMDVAQVKGSASLADSTMWWYTARSRLLATVFAARVPRGGLVLDVGSADGPSVEWLATIARRIPVDLDPRGLTTGGVQANALRLPFADGTFDAVTAFDVVEHFPDDDELMIELVRVSKPRAALFITVPAYQWAWSVFDEDSGHYRRYTAFQVKNLARRHHCHVDRMTYLFGSTLPFFALSRWLLPRLGIPTSRQSRLPDWMQRAFLALTRAESWFIKWGHMPVGSSVAAVLYCPSSQPLSSLPLQPR